MENRNNGNGIRRKKLRSGVQREQFRTRERVSWRYVSIGGNFTMLAFVASEDQVDISKIMELTDQWHNMHPHLVIITQERVSDKPEKVWMAINYRHYNNAKKLEHIRSVLYEMHLYLNIADETALFGGASWVFNEKRSMIFGPGMATSLSTKKSEDSSKLILPAFK